MWKAIVSLGKFHKGIYPWQWKLYEQKGEYIKKKFKKKVDLFFEESFSGDLAMAVLMRGQVFIEKNWFIF